MLERWVWGQPAGAGGVPYTQPRPRHWGCSRKCMKRQSPPFLPCLLPDTQNAKYRRRASDERSFGHQLNPQPQLTPGQLVSPVALTNPNQTHPWGLEPVTRIFLPSRPHGHLPGLASLPFPEASTTGYRRRSFEPPALIAGSNYSPSFRANS